MKILYITQYFLPEICAPSNRAYANVKYFSEKGHKVVILTEMPNHPKGVIFKGYKGKIFNRERIENFDVLRVWVYANPNKNFITRLLFYMSFMFLGLLYALLNWKNFDVVYISSPPLFVGIVGISLKSVFPKTKFIFEVRDLWPTVAIALGELKNKTFIKFSRKLEYTCYLLSDKIISVTNFFKQEIINKGVHSKKVLVVKNGTDIKNEIQVNTQEVKSKLGLKFDFVVLYAGNLGLAQGLETVLCSAKKLKNENDIKFFLIGEGPEKKKLKGIAKTLNLNNIKFIDEVSMDEISEYLSIAKCGIVPLKKSKVFSGTVPSKLYDYMACELPILLGVDGEAKSILEKSGGGLSFEPENSDDLAEKILYLKNNPKQLKNMALNGRKFVEENCNREKQAEVIEKELLELLEQK